MWVRRFSEGSLRLDGSNEGGGSAQLRKGFRRLEGEYGTLLWRDMSLRSTGCNGVADAGMSGAKP
jgi:hypothetical protein